MRVETEDLPRDSWTHFLRARDLAQLVQEAPSRLGLEGPVLEVGCGDGSLTALLRKRFDVVVPMDIKLRAHVSGACVADAQILPFQDGAFQMVFSSNVLEHVLDLESCMAEMRRVMRDDGVMVHTMPTTTWKVAALALYPLHLLVHVAIPKAVGKLTRRRSKIEPTKSVSHARSEEGPRESRLRSLLIPGIHGSASSHREEIRNFGKKSWTKRFKSSDLEVLKTTPMYLHSAYQFFPFRALVLRDLASRLGLASVRAYWARKP